MATKAQMRDPEFRKAVKERRIAEGQCTYNLGSTTTHPNDQPGVSTLCKKHYEVDSNWKRKHKVKKKQNDPLLPNQEPKRRSREERLAAGLCVDCPKDSPQPICFERSKTLCFTHLEIRCKQYADRVTSLKEAGLCVICKAPCNLDQDSHPGCYAELKQKRPVKDAELCLYGGCKELKHEGSCYCLAHKEQETDRKRARREKGICISCNNPVMANRLRCLTHTLKMAATKHLDSPELWEQLVALYEAQGGVCKATGRPIELGNSDSMEVDHIHPRSKGGANHISNLHLVTTEFNVMKRDLTHPELLLLVRDYLHAFWGISIPPRAELDELIVRKFPPQD